MKCEVTSVILASDTTTHQYCHIFRAWNGRLQRANVSTTTISMRITPRRARSTLLDEWDTCVSWVPCRWWKLFCAGHVVTTTLSDSTDTWVARIMVMRRLVLEVCVFAFKVFPAFRRKWRHLTHPWRQLKASDGHLPGFRWHLWFACHTCCSASGGNCSSSLTRSYFAARCAAPAPVSFSTALSLFGCTGPVERGKRYDGSGWDRKRKKENRKKWETLLRS